MLQISGCYKSSSWMLVVLVALSMLMASCNKSEKTTAEKSAQKTFATPGEAGAALLQAAKSGDQTALVEIFGPDGKEVLFTGDVTKDKDHLQDFVAAYSQMNRWVLSRPGGKFFILEPTTIHSRFRSVRILTAAGTLIRLQAKMRFWLAVSAKASYRQSPR